MTRQDYSAIGETLYRDRLENGLRISVLTKPGYTRCFALFCTNYGGADRRFRLGNSFRDTPAGVAHFLEHKMFDMPEGDNALSVLAANGAQPNAFTSSGMTAYYFESTANFYENLDMLLRFVSTPYFTEESVQKEQGIIGQEIRMCEDSPDYVIYDEALRCLYEHNPVRDSVAGTVESIAEITPEILYDCHSIFYNPVNMCLAVVGDVDPEKVEEAARRILPSKRGEKPISDYGPAEKETPAKPRFTRAMEVSAPQFLIAGKLRPEEKGKKLLMQKLVSGLALSYLFSQSSPFYTRLYAEGLLNTDFSSGVDYAARTMTFLAGGESRDPERVFSELCGTIEDTCKNGLEPGLWSRTRKAAYGMRIRALSSFYGMCLSLAEADFGDYNCLDSFKLVAGIQGSEVLDFIKNELKPERLAMSVITPERTGENGNA